VQDFLRTVAFFVPVIIPQMGTPYSSVNKWQQNQGVHSLRIATVGTIGHSTNGLV
jgi:hypothetical protein